MAIRNFPNITYSGRRPGLSNPGLISGPPNASQDAAGQAVSESLYFDAAPSSNTGQIKVWNGSAWVLKPVKWYNGSSWVTKPLKRWDGASWVTTL